MLMLMLMLMLVLMIETVNNDQGAAFAGPRRGKRMPNDE
jgi:hypothetical protein